MIYEFAIQDTMAALFVIPAWARRGIPNPPRLGAMALVRTTNFVRKESSNATYPIVDRQYEALLARSKYLHNIWWTMPRRTPPKLVDEAYHRSADATDHFDMIHGLRLDPGWTRSSNIPSYERVKRAIHQR